MVGFVLWMVLGSGVQAQSPAAVPSTTTTEAPKEDPAVTALALKIYQQMRAGKVDPALITEAMQKGMTPEALAQSKPMFDQLGDPTKLALESKETIAQGTRWLYLVTFPAAQLHVAIFVDNAGKVGGYFLRP